MCLWSQVGYQLQVGQKNLDLISEKFGDIYTPPVDDHCLTMYSDVDQIAVTMTVTMTVTMMWSPMV